MFGILDLAGATIGLIFSLTLAIMGYMVFIPSILEAVVTIGFAVGLIYGLKSKRWRFLFIYVIWQVTQ